MVKSIFEAYSKQDTARGEYNNIDNSFQQETETYQNPNTTPIMNVMENYSRSAVDSPHVIHPTSSERYAQRSGENFTTPHPSFNSRETFNHASQPPPPRVTAHKFQTNKTSPAPIQSQAEPPPGPQPAAATPKITPVAASLESDKALVDYIAMSYQIANALRKEDPVAYKQCSQFYQNDNTIYLIIILFLLVCCIYFYKLSNKEGG